VAQRNSDRWMTHLVRGNLRPFLVDGIGLVLDFPSTFFFL
jgi:hypothetical protein